ncbi:restriction endonuclease fold toxin 5 domain-containing protein [Achromobacter piechaudii]|uniref:restriction endonuclease fold toxin 5 domain-containing protein n=1 Tax=Achromobacter piechaudii TaxID=72556 RepID=UPI003DAA1AF4
MPGPLAIPIAGWIAEAIAAALARAAAGAAAGAVLGGVATLPGDTPREDSEAKPTDRALPRTGEPCKKCPPDLGLMVRRRHGVNWNAYEYQARVTGFAYDTEYCQWSDEWNWENTDFDGFVSAECLLQETKGNYDQFLDGSIPGSEDFFKGFDSMERQAIMQGTRVRMHPPAKLKWYFQTGLTHQRMSILLAQLGVLSETKP